MITFCLFLGSCQNSTSEIDSIMLFAQPIKAVSGQTIEVVIPQHDHQTLRVRIIGIDVPKQKDRVWQKKAQVRLQELINNRDLLLELENSEPDSYNRILAHVWEHELLISEQLAKEGYAIANPQYPHKYSDRLFYAQEYARILGYGIWE